MARKYDLISEMYRRTAHAVVSDVQNWQAFLRCACRNYRLRFDEQLLIYAQRPDATAVLEIERWNDKFGRWVNRGAKGIAVFEDADRSRQRLIHYFDISDTHESRYSRPVPIWDMKPEYTDDVIESLENTFGEYIAKKGLSQLRIAETEKYAHVTFFFNGGVEAPFENEDRALINSPKVATYDLQPEMSAYLVCDEVLKRIESDKYDAIILNYANCDMVGHTGVFDAAVAAVEAVDECVGKTVDAVLAKGGIALITADHGNADKMMEEDGSPFTAHTTNLVPLIIAGAGNVLIREGGVLADLSPTMLKLMGLEQPKEMTGKSIIKD